MTEVNWTDRQAIEEILYQKMQRIHPGVADLEPYEFGYLLDNVTPVDGWNSVTLDAPEIIEKRVNDVNFYQSIQLRPRKDNRPVMDEQVLRLTQMLLAGLVDGSYAEAWILRHFYFDLRGFYFFHRTEYMNAASIAHLGGKPFRQFEPKQKAFERLQSVGYKAFKEANAEIDGALIGCVKKLIEKKGTPILVAIAGQTAAGKTEITARMQEIFVQAGWKITTIEMDNFLTDRDYREANGIDSLGQGALHYEMMQQCLKDICAGKKITTPRYDFIQATSSHTLEGELREGCVPVEIEPADIIFIEGNFPFLLSEIVPLIGIKIAYMTDDPVRLQRKWKRDMDYRKKYDLMYFLNRYFREQYLMAGKAYTPQLETCDILVDTTRAALWVAPEIAGMLS